APTDEAPEVVGLRERPLGPGRVDLQPDLREEVAKVSRYALAEREIHAGRMIHDDAHRTRRDALDEQDLDLGLDAREAALDVGLDLLVGHVRGEKKVGCEAHLQVRHLWPQMKVPARRV